MRPLLIFLIVLNCGCTSLEDSTDNSIETVFESFFNVPYEMALGDTAVQLIVDERHMAYHSIPVKMHFDIEKIKKVLLLKLKQTGYYYNGFYTQECADDPVYIASFELNPDAKISELGTQFNTHCYDSTIHLLLWVQTNDGTFYSTYKEIKIIYESPG